MPIHSKINDRNFITKLTKYEHICSISNSMTVLDDFFPIFFNMITHKKTGTYNCTNPGTINHNEILEMYKEIIDPNFEWENFSQEEQRKILAADRSNNYLDTSKLETLYPKIKHIRNSIRDCLIEYKKTLKEEIYMLKCWLEIEYNQLPAFEGEEQWEQNRILEILKK
jgi:hypothetical protein